MAGHRAVKNGDSSVVEAIVAPIYFRLLLSRDKLDRRFLEHLAESAAAAAALAAHN